MTGYNNKKYVLESLKSAINQNYKNFEIIYVDDCSTDGTREILKNNFKNVNFTFNTTRQGKLANLYNTIHKIDDNKIILELDADDYLKDEFVLQRFNYLFQNKKCLVAHANYKNNPESLAKKLKLQTFSQCTPWFVKKYNLYRKFPWIYSGLRSYQAKLFKKIKKEDLMFEGKFLDIFHDAAMFYPILEMANGKVGYINEKLLIRNIDSPINDFKRLPNNIDKIKNQVLKHMKHKSLEIPRL